MGYRDRYVTVTPGQPKEKKKCLVVQVSYPPGNMVWLKPTDADFEGEEHLYFTSANRYVALFWGGPAPSGFDIISLNRLKSTKQAVQSLEWPKLADPEPKLIGLHQAPG
jgi:hypothetical protein